MKSTIKQVFFLPQNMVCEVKPDPKAICIGIRGYLPHHEEYSYAEGFKAVGYFAEGVPYIHDTVEKQDEYILTVRGNKPRMDRIQVADNLGIPITKFIKNNLEGVETVYINCVQGLSRSFAIAEAIRFAHYVNGVEITVEPFGNHTRDDSEYVPDLLLHRTAGRIADLL